MINNNNSIREVDSKSGESSYSSSEASINDEEIANEIADEEEDNSNKMLQSAGYSSGLSIFKVAAGGAAHGLQNSSVNNFNMNTSNNNSALINMKGLSHNGGVNHTSSENNTMDIKVNNISALNIKQSLTSAINQIPSAMSADYNEQQK